MRYSQEFIVNPVYDSEVDVDRHTERVSSELASIVFLDIEKCGHPHVVSIKRESIPFQAGGQSWEVVKFTADVKPVQTMHVTQTVLDPAHWSPPTVLSFWQTVKRWTRPIFAGPFPGAPENEEHRSARVREANDRKFEAIIRGSN